MLDFRSLLRKFLDREFSNLNDRQREAVFSVSGNLLVLAGAGSGKTTVIVNRIYAMLKYGDLNFCEFDDDSYELLSVGFDEGKSLSDFKDVLRFCPIAPENILSITFTNKAAKEIKERLRSKLGDCAERIWASTFHSMCAKILRIHAESLGYSTKFAIYDSDDTKRLIKECMKTLNIEEKNLPIKSCMSRISSAKDALVDPLEFKIRHEHDFKMSKISQIYELYEDRKKSSDAMDFDDLIMNTVLLFREHPNIREKYVNRFKYVMVDEYQDTSESQHELIKLLTGKSGDLCVVGDDDQSIYKFRGANVDNILSFDKYFDNVKVIRLEQNYRSSGNILLAANSVIKNNSSRKVKSLWTKSDSGPKVRVHISYSEHDEAELIAKNIVESVKNGRKYSDFAVLYRSGMQSAVIEKLLTRNSIPFRVIGNVRFFERKEIKDILSYLNVVNNPNDEVRLRRIINRPNRTIGDRTLASISEVAQNSNKSFFDIVQNCSDYKELQRASGKVSLFSSLINEFINANSKGMPLHELYDFILDKIGYIDFLRANEDDPEPRIENMNELRNYILIFESEHEDDATLSSFLEEVSLVSDSSSSENERDFVSLMTIHASKGLEFPVVFLPGFEEGIFPSQQCIYEPESIEEERRLAYVALTRAKEQIFISHATSRMTYGSTSHNKPSRFISEIPEEIMEVTKSKDWKKLSSSDKIPHSNKDVRVKSVVLARSFGSSKSRVLNPRINIISKRNTPISDQEHIV